MREGREQQLAEKSLAEGAGQVALNLGAGWFDELVVLDPGGAGGHAGHAAEAVVHVLPEAGVEGGFARRRLS